MVERDWLKDLLGWKAASKKSTNTCEELFRAPLAPNIADLGNRVSLLLAGRVFDKLEIPQSQLRKNVVDVDNNDSVKKSRRSSSGAALERGIANNLGTSLKELDKDRGWEVSQGARVPRVSSFAQFLHLDDLQKILLANHALKASFARDYHISTDVLIGVPNSSNPTGPLFLHAAISSKWTIRSDRVQNVRHEFAMLVRNRRGRAPHLVLVTAEPQPSRLVSIARGTGEIDAVYHLLFDEINEAVGEICHARSRYKKQRDDWTEMVEQRRLRPYKSLATDLTLS